MEVAFGSKQIKVKAMIEGMSNHIFILKGICEQIGKTFGDELKVSAEADVDERVATVPAELKRAFQSDKAAKSVFEKLSYTHQKEYVIWINDAKKAVTRARRVEQTIKLLKERKKGK